MPASDTAQKTFPSYSELLQRSDAPPGSSWGLFGKDDEIGMVNFITRKDLEGFEFNGNGQVPRPRLRVANVTGAITALVLTYQDLVGAKITRKRTLAKYLDAVNFEGGVNPTADPSAEFADDVYYVDRKSRETRDVVEFELAASFDLEGVTLPRRQIVQNVCPWRYRGSECGYTGTAYLDANDQAVGSSSLDICGKRLSSCKARFGQSAELPFGGFPAAGLIR